MRHNLTQPIIHNIMAQDILQEIVARKRVEVAQLKEALPLCDLERQVMQQMDSEKQPLPSMRTSLMSSPTGIIAELKRRSPSKGWINETASPDVIPLAYQDNGAAAVSILTDTCYFGGDDTFITRARTSGLTLPVLYKNFIIDAYQVLQARLCGASAILLIAADLTLAECRDLLTLAHSLGMEVLLEMHEDRELDYMSVCPDMYGINNRHLGSFDTDVNTSFLLSSQLPEGACWVSESGISHPQTVRRLREAGFRGFLIGENFMKTSDPGTALAQFIEGLSPYTSIQEPSTI